MIILVIYDPRQDHQCHCTESGKESSQVSWGMMATTFIGHSSHVVVNMITSFAIIISFRHLFHHHHHHHHGRHSTVWSFGHCGQHYPQQQTLYESYGRINLSDVQYHSSVTNKKGAQLKQINSYTHNRQSIIIISINVTTRRYPIRPSVHL